MSFKLQSWRKVLLATVDMKVDSCYRWSTAMAAGDLTGLVAAAKLHNDAERIAAAHRPKAS
jgi:hypothetical protein